MQGEGTREASPASSAGGWAQLPPSPNLGPALRRENLGVYTRDHRVRSWRHRHLRTGGSVHETSGKQKWGSALPWEGPSPPSLPELFFTHVHII